jgi:hypothetical protein
MLLVFALTLFLSATLLFLVEPMVGKMILPLLGGTPAVWNTCMVFFQAILLAGYAYAHATTAWLGPRKQAAMHLAILVIPLFFFPLGINRALLASGEENPVFPLLLMLITGVGVPLFVVCTSAPLLQKWFSATTHPAARDPYFLYGASNLGSMLALLGYPALVEPLLRLHQQTWWWAVAYGLLALLAAACAIFLWRSPPAPAVEGSEPTPTPSTAIRTDLRNGKHNRKRKHADKVTATPPAAQAVAERGLEMAGALSQDVTPLRRLRWVLLAVVPSSLMLGATTFITTDIAAIPLLWVLPLALYLLSFIIVFSSIRLQNISLGFLGTAVGIGLGWYLWRLPDKSTLEAFQRTGPVVAVKGLAILMVVGGLLSWFALRARGNALHRTMVLLMPLIVLLLVFFMLSEYKLPWVGYTIALHLATLFLVAMVCHGELARDRPGTKHLTEYFLWMSVGGVIGGLFNALFAPLAFNAIVEYPLALMGACLLLPALSDSQGSSWGRTFDFILAGMFVFVGVLLLGLRYKDHDLEYHRLAQGPWVWQLVGVLLALGLGAFVALRAKTYRTERWLDLLLPATLLVLVMGLGWGLYSAALSPRMYQIADKLGIKPYSLRLVLSFGLPTVLCYTFVERSPRFGLGLGAVLLGSAICAGTEAGLLLQKRSFFGVLRVEAEKTDPDLYDQDREPTILAQAVLAADVVSFVGQAQCGQAIGTGVLPHLLSVAPEVVRTGQRRIPFYRLIHGTTLHGKQFRDPYLRYEPITYYHWSGPVGHIFRNYNTDPERPFGVIGLGTGSMACYALPGQHVTFYDIDREVRDISFNAGGYFTFVEDARRRGAHIEPLVLGDARVTMERQHLAPEQRYRLLVIDAFSSDAIPIHLITREAVEVFLDHLAEDGILCFHISNRYLDLRPVLANLAEAAGLAAVYESDDQEDYPGKARSSWVLLARKREDLKLLGDLKQPATDPKVGVWTDDYSNLLSVFGR